MGALVAPLTLLFGFLLLAAIVGGAKQRRSSRVVEGAIGAFALVKLWTWAFSNLTFARFIGMVIGGLVMAGILFTAHNVHDTETAPDVRPVPLNDGPVAIKPLATAPRFTPPPWAPQAPAVVVQTPHGRMGPTIDLTPTAGLYGGPPLKTRPGPWPAQHRLRLVAGRQRC
jgi:hypothetical protein